MRLVSDNGEAEIAANRALREISWRLRDLTANLLRVARGAGRAWELKGQLYAAVEALEHYAEAAKTWPSPDELEAILREWDEIPEDLNDDYRMTVYAEHQIVRGAIQWLASTYLSQRTQQAAGHHEMYDGVNAIERRREELRRQYAERRQVESGFTRVVTQAPTKRASPARVASPPPSASLARAKSQEADQRWTVMRGRLRKWRSALAARLGCPIGAVLNDSAIESILAKKPATVAQLCSISGISKFVRDQHVEELIELINAPEN